MELTPPVAVGDANPASRVLPAEIDLYLTRVGQEHRRFLNALGDANRDLDQSSGQLAKVASIQARLTQEFLDAQRAILKRRAETDADVADIRANADHEATTVLLAARSRACIAVGRPLPPPGPGSWAAPMAGRAPTPAVRPSLSRPPSDASESLARLIDGAFEQSEPDGVAARRQLRELLDGWWEAEKQEAKAAADDAAAHAAMRLHTARIEAGEIARFGPPSTSPQPAAVYRYQPPAALPQPMVDALDDADHEHLDDVLAHLLDELDHGPRQHIEPSSGDDDAAPPSGTAMAPPALPSPVSLDGRAPRLPPPADSLTDRTAAPQEAFDRFWTGFGGAGTRRWLFPQLLLPAVTVIAVLALVLAVVG